jgi:hypothetical protein
MTSVTDEELFAQLPVLIRHYYRESWRPMLYVFRGRKYAHCVLRDNARGVVLRGIPLRDVEKYAKPLGHAPSEAEMAQRAVRAYLQIGEQHGISDKAYNSLQAIQGS